MKSAGRTRWTWEEAEVADLEDVAIRDLEDAEIRASVEDVAVGGRGEAVLAVAGRISRHHSNSRFTVEYIC